MINILIISESAARDCPYQTGLSMHLGSLDQTLTARQNLGQGLSLEVVACMLTAYFAV